MWFAIEKTAILRNILYKQRHNKELNEGELKLIASENHRYSYLALYAGVGSMPKVVEKGVWPSRKHNA